MLSSVIGRCAACSSSEEAAREINEICVNLLNMLNNTISQKPILPRIDNYSIQSAVDFLKHITQALTAPTPLRVLSDVVRKNVCQYIKSREFALHKLRQVAPTLPEILVCKKSIEEMFELPGMFATAETLAKQEIDRFKDASTHPSIPQEFCRVITNAEAHNALFDATSILMTHQSPAIRIARGSSDGRHMSWALADGVVEYFIPADLTLADFFSWDFPHNFAHVLHLSKYCEKGIVGYLDQMRERAYHESVAVYSEHLLLKHLEAAQFHKQYFLREEWFAWLIQDRRHEFLLRAIRLVADAMSATGVPFTDIVEHVSVSTGVPQDKVQLEVQRYYAWFGLGAVYTTGYCQLANMELTFSNCIEADDTGRKVRTWFDLMNKYKMPQRSQFAAT